MKKRLLTIAVIFSMATVSFSGCTEKELPPAPSDMPEYNRNEFNKPVEDDPYKDISNRDIWKVMKNRKKLYDTATDTELYFQDLKYNNYMSLSIDESKRAFFKYEDATKESKPLDITPILWAEANLDNDTSMDLRIVLNNQKTLYLKDMGGSINAFFFNYEDLHDIKTDGSFILEGTGFQMVGNFVFFGNTPYLSSYAAHINLKALNLTQEYGIKDDWFVVSGSETDENTYSDFVENTQKKKESLDWIKFNNNIV